MEERIVSSEERKDEAVMELSLRPEALDEYIGQSSVKDNLN